MKYPTVSRTRAIDIARSRLDGESPVVTAEWEGGGDELDTATLELLSDDLQKSYSAFLEGDGGSDIDRFEGILGTSLHAALEQLDVPVGVLDDSGFWRFLSINTFWWFVERREPGAFKTKDPGRFALYIDGRRPTECILLRAYLRGRIAAECGDPKLSSAIPQATDFWRSHVIRVRTGSAPAVAAAFAREHRDNRMGTKELRPYARRLNRLWTNVVLHVYEPAEATALISELRE